MVISSSLCYEIFHPQEKIENATSGGGPGLEETHWMHWKLQTQEAMKGPWLARKV